MNPPAALPVGKPGNKVIETAVEETSAPVTTTASNSPQYVRRVDGRPLYHLNLLLANLCIAESVSRHAGKRRATP